MSDRDSGLGQELLEAMQTGGSALPPTARFPDFDMASAYAVENEFKRLRGGKAVGLKVGYANKAMWRVLKLDTLVWAHMYEDSVHHGKELALPHYRSPKIEPEIVFKMGEAGGVEWIAFGFEVIDCPYPDWQFKPVDFVAAGGLHMALVVGEPSVLTPEMNEQLARFKVRLLKNGVLVEEGSGKNCLRSPALCLEELAGKTTLSAGDLVSSGTLTAGAPVAKGDVWSVEIEDLPISPLSLTFL